MAKTTKKALGIESKMKDLTEFEEALIVVLYGRSGSGKTTLASTFPKPILFVDVKDHGTESAKSVDLKKGDITVLSLDSFDEIFEVYDYLEENPNKFKTVVIDHMTALQEQALEKVKNEESKGQVSQRMFGIASGHMKEAIMAFRQLTDLGITPVFLAQDRTDEVETAEDDMIDPEIGPGVMPALAKILTAGAKVVGHTYIAEVKSKNDKGKVKIKAEYRLRIGPNPYFVTKIRRPKGTQCPEYITNPTYDDLLNITLGKWSEGKKSTEKKKTKLK